MRKPSAAIVCALLVGVFYLATIRHGHDWGDDFSMYIRHAQNIVAGLPYGDTGYIYNPLNPSVGPRVYPPGFPLLLSPVIALFGLNFFAMKALIVGCFVGALVLLVPLFRQSLPPRYLAALVLIVGLNPRYWVFKDSVESDMPFLFLTLLSLYAFARADDAAGGDGGRRRMRWGVLSGIVAYAACATRAVGIVFVPCVIAYDVIRYRRIRRRTTAAVTTCVALLIVQQFLLPQDSGYFDTLSGSGSLLRVALANAGAYLRWSFPDFLDNGYSDPARKILFVAVAALAVTGYVASARRRVELHHVYPVCALVPVLLWPAAQGTRLLLPIAPFFFAFGLFGVLFVSERLAPRWRFAHALGGACFAVVGVTYVARYTTMPFGSVPEGIATRDAVALFDFIKTRTAADDVAVFSRPRALALFTGRRASGGYEPADPCDLWRYWRTIRASYVVTGPARDPFNGDAAYLQRFVSRYPEDLQRVMANSDVAVYRIAGDPCEGGGRPAPGGAR